ncbi:hypothetical protein E5676_scaffold142G003960 [Cucumis melo var. makuwa]|uniref:Uncharacterized protein n=1 Tax=Cucumis melo var. makuwa TaxID=1194695 RepID=A0A5D3DID0_CUCMM|nr:hypothetical protein E5676_scaffold142G003960 [Cucumis melo var. makuwa]
MSSHRVGPCTILRSQLRAKATSFEPLPSSSAPIRHHRPVPSSTIRVHRHLVSAASSKDRALSSIVKPDPRPSPTSLLGKRYFAVRTRLSKSPDMIRVVRWNSSQPDCLSVSSGYTTDQIVLGISLGSPKTSYVPPGSHVARVRERASFWAGAEIRAKASWRATRSDRGEP